MNLEEFLSVTNHCESGDTIRPYIVCNDGFEISVQASKCHYCSPRENDADYNSVEIFVEKKDKSIEQLLDKNKVAGWVKHEIVQNLIDKHEGINEQATFKDV